MFSILLYDEGYAGLFYLLPKRTLPFLLAEDLATFYAVPLKRINEQIRLHPARFPEESFYRLTSEEAALIEARRPVSKGVGASADYGPLAFTEMGACLVAALVESPKAIQVYLAFIKKVAEETTFEDVLGRARDA